MKEEQTVSGITPAFWPRAVYFPNYRSDRFAMLRTLWEYFQDTYHAYAGYWIIHRVISVIFFGAIGLSLWNLIQFFTDRVLIPARLLSN